MMSAHCCQTCAVFSASYLSPNTYAPGGTCGTSSSSMTLTPKGKTPSQSGWGDLFADKYEQVLDESTGQWIMVDKNAPKYKLDEKGNVINLKKESRAQSSATESIDATSFRPVLDQTLASTNGRVHERAESGSF